ncbi:amidohydrolase family protein [Gordonia sp. HNM0687]|uniref:Amidohydrolase family protein n=1 Tax=Gordonia mangrovi TaxID=2665643 RepID=A0A6L7GN20_9ACTN|nr:amidohydrolase family protein [Gordonia mangrovi]MXP21310.1 amidohydrolase family protein [Gordonia mangrovi]UVF80059.1 amidohydrolase family protein [Gordonia mangrovi]
MQPTPPQAVRGITGSLPDGSVVDITLFDDNGVSRVGGIRPHDAWAEDTSQPDWLDLRGFVLTAAAAEPHAHLDKALSWSELSPPLGDLGDAIASWRSGSVHLDEESFRRRALQTATAMLRNGITAVRTHADVLHDDDPLRAVRALADVREQLRGLMTIQIAVLASPTTPTALVEGALDAGADLVGGAPHIADDPLADVIRLLDLAEKRGIGADLHIDEFMDGDHLTIEAFADRVADWPRDRIRTAGHCSRLATLPPADLQRVARTLTRASVSVIALPITNLYLQGRHGPSAGRRGITAIDALRDAGVLVAAGADNVRDPFNPVGRADPLETAALLVAAAHQSPDTALELVTDSARAVLGLEPAGPQVGARADFLAVRGTDVVDTIATAPADRVVIVNGAIVARTETTSWTAAPAAAIDSISRTHRVMENK